MAVTDAQADARKGFLSRDSRIPLWLIGIRGGLVLFLIVGSLYLIVLVRRNRARRTNYRW